jgi:hypothetical protein
MTPHGFSDDAIQPYTRSFRKGRVGQEYCWGSDVDSLISMVLSSLAYPATDSTWSGLKQRIKFKTNTFREKNSILIIFF